MNPTSASAIADSASLSRFRLRWPIVVPSLSVGRILLTDELQLTCQLRKWFRGDWRADCVALPLLRPREWGELPPGVAESDSRIPATGELLERGLRRNQEPHRWDVAPGTYHAPDSYPRISASPTPARQCVGVSFLTGMTHL
jgi:hypothetical protein